MKTRGRRTSRRRKLELSASSHLFLSFSWWPSLPRLPSAFMACFDTVSISYFQAIVISLQMEGTIHIITTRGFPQSELLMFITVGNDWPIVVVLGVAALWGVLGGDQHVFNVRL
mmetsp:Transcript_3678/g.8343  ORF Transcript_3678/g.8343 Transcript_3678/m.8343 type:complete len:114 (+) Transcript_3678:635-976(+)